ncbi:MAG: Calcineurin-like phosphoesterase [Candidatus Accumulibacter vicinus]|uniref:Calcineurin-like phosphoesterase n=1 Tax=Candidatus Accumulibacter vicinus TaxID=2954382 RepID=A0A084XVR4_9PROT|nr:MAG: Calcineurin-like phosphoesterase [Candidatus Accumulibacter vicinus]
MKRRATRRHSLRLSSLLAWLKGVVARLGFGWGHDLRLGDSYRLGSSKVRVPLDGLPIEISLGLNDKRLHLYPETRLDQHGEPVRLGSFIIVDPSAHRRRISGFLRLTPKSWLSLGSADTLQKALFDYPAAVDEQHLVVIHGRDALVFRNLSDAGTRIGPVPAEDGWLRERLWRRLREIFGGPIAPLPRDEAMQLIDNVNRLLQKEIYRPIDERGLPGGLLLLPSKLTPIIVADMHAQIDNLLTILSQNTFLDALEQGTAVLVIIGDAVHSEIDGQLREMESSMLMMDLIFRLKLHFPEQVFYLRGNHDSFSEDMSKDGIPQGLLWARELGERRGTAYLKAMEEFYRLLPYVVASEDFVACHAAPPTSKVSIEMLVQIYRYPKLVIELINNRLQRPNRPQGYHRRDVKRFRQCLRVNPETPLIVGHTPIDREDTLWLDVDGIANHHVLFSASPDQVGVFTRIGDTMVPLRYPVDALTPIINALDSAPD